jgi:uncharacterized membrane protein YqaE (UPF0057 family)
MLAIWARETTMMPSPDNPMKILLVILCFLLPPLAVYLASKDVKATLINLVLCFLFYVPGLIHALWVVLKK